VPFLGAAAFRAAVFLRPAAFFAVFFAAAGRRFGLEVFRANAREVARLVVRLFADVFFCRFVEPFRVERATVRFAAFLAIVIDPRSVMRSVTARE
jgi:hypothetical protein